MSIPEFPDFAPIDLGHKPEVDEVFTRIEPAISEFTFTNLFIWRFYYNISVSKMLGHLLFLAQPSGKQPFFYPPWGDGATGLVIKRCLQFLSDKWGGGYIERVPQDYVDKYADSLTELKIMPDPVNDDYVYSWRGYWLYSNEELSLVIG